MLFDLWRANEACLDKPEALSSMLMVMKFDSFRRDNVANSLYWLLKESNFMSATR